MSSIQIHLEAAESDAVQHFAEALGVSDEDVVYAALNRLMHDAKVAEDDIGREILHVRQARSSSRPPWGDSDGCVHHFASADDAQAVPGHWCD